MKKTNSTLVESLNQVLEAAKQLDSKGIRHSNSTIKSTVKKNVRLALAKTIVVSAKTAEIATTTAKIIRSRNGRYILGQLVKTYVLNKVRECKKELELAEQEEANTNTQEEDSSNEYMI